MRVRQLKLNWSSEHSQPKSSFHPGFGSIEQGKVNLTLCARLVRGMTVLAYSATVCGLVNGALEPPRARNSYKATHSLMLNAAAG